MTEEPKRPEQKWNYVIQVKGADKYRVFNPNHVEYFNSTH